MPFIGISYSISYTPFVCAHILFYAYGNAWMSVGCTKYRCVDGANNAAAVAAIPITYRCGSKWLMHALTKIFLSLYYTVCIVLAYFTLVRLLLLLFLFHVATHSQYIYFFRFFSFAFLIVYFFIVFSHSLLPTQWVLLNGQYKCTIWVRGSVICFFFNFCMYVCVWGGCMFLVETKF